MSKRNKEKKPAEESLFLRMLWFALTFTCFYLVALVDPNVSHLSFCGINIPLLFVYFWIAIIGSSASYRHRRQEVKWLEFVGLTCVGMTCFWFVETMRNQFVAGGEIDFLLPTTLLITGMFVSHSFELRTRFDFNFSLVISLIIVCYAAALGKGAWFGLGMFVYVTLAAALLLLDCEARTFGIVQARTFDSAQSYLTFDRRGSSEKTANLVVPTLALLCLSICFFLTVPRAESLADQVTSRICSLVKQNLAPPVPRLKNLATRERLPIWHKNAKDSTPKTDDQDRIAAQAEESTKASSGKDQKQTKADSSKTGKSATQNKVKHSFSRRSEKAGTPNKREQTQSANLSTKHIATPGIEESAAKSDKNAMQSPAQATAANSASHAAGADSAESPPAADSASRQTAGNKGKTGSTPSTSAHQANVNQAAKNTGDENNEPAITNSQNKNSTPAKRPVAHVMPDTLDADLPADTANLPIFSVACDRTVFFRQGAFDNYDGHCWHISPGVVQIELIRGTRGTFSLRDIPAVTKTDVVPAIRLTQKFHVLENLGGKIIVAGNPSEISYPGPAITVDTCNNLTAAWFLVPGLEYSVYSDEPMYDLEAMRSEGIPSEAEESKLRSRLAVFRQIPDNQPERLYDLSQEIAGLSDNWFVQAEKICSYLRHEYKYSNDPKYKTAAINSSDRFLFDTRTGDCKDFATAFVLMCRASGIPARLVMGFSAGDFDPATGTRLVKLKNSHTWGEIYFPSTGWVPFDPTPQGILPAKQKEKERYFTTIGQNFENSIRTAKVAENLGQQATAPQMQIRLPDGSIFTIAIDFWQLWKCLPLLFVALVVYAPLAELIKSLAKNICWPKARHPASKCYAQVLKDLKVLGINSPDSQTPGEFLAQVKEKLAGGDDPDRSRRLAQAVEEFISCYNATFYGAQGPASELEKKQLKVHELIKS